MAANYPDPLPIPSYGYNHFANPGAETDAVGVTPFYEYIPPPDTDPADQPPLPDPGTLLVARATNLFHSGAASFRIDKTVAVDRTYSIGVELTMTGLTVTQGYLVDYYLYLPPGSGANVTNATLGLQPMPSVIDPTLQGPEDLGDTDDRSVGLTMRADPPTQESTWLRQQVTFYATAETLVFRLTITYNDVYAGPQAFYLDDINVWNEYSLGTSEDIPPTPVPTPEPPPVVLVPPVPTVICTLDPRSLVTPVVLVAGYNLFTDVRSYWMIETLHPDGTARQIPPDTLATFEGEYTTYDDIVSGYNEVLEVYRRDGHRLNEKIQYKYNVPIQNGTFAIMDLDAPMDTWYQYDIKISTSIPGQPTIIMTTPVCAINSSLYAPEYAGCSAALISDPLVPSLAQWVGLTSIDALSWPGRRELFEVISARYPIAQADLRMMARTTIRCITQTLIERDKMLEIMATGRILRLRIADPQYPEANWYLSIGNLSEVRIFPDHRRPERRWELEVAVVERPVGVVNSWDFNRSYLTLRNYEDDGSTALTPQTYEHIRYEYTDYLAALYGKTYTLDTAGIPSTLVYGDGRWPTAQSVKTSINWTPELGVP